MASPLLHACRPTAFVVGRGVDLETATAVKDLAFRMGTAAVYKEGGSAGEDYPNHFKLTDVDEVYKANLLPLVRRIVLASKECYLFS